MGSPRRDGNTAEILKPLQGEFRTKDCEVDYIFLGDKTIRSCKGCFVCQDVEGDYGCPQKDDMQDIIKSVMQADLLIYATPIYSWFCTPEMKSVMDRLFGMNKYYGTAPKGTLWKGLKVALVATCGYEIDNAVDLLEKALKNLCAHSGLEFMGTYAVRDIDGLADFRTVEAVQGARQFAHKLINDIR